jgi:O-antigen/teichoic acid export membrane protein
VATAVSSASRAPARSIARTGVLTVATTASTLVVNLATGILIARVLGPSGRGALTAVLAAPPIVAWVFETVVKSLYATLAIAILFAGTIVYGADFAGSVAPLRILLAGTVLYAAAAVVCSGLYALNRPFTRLGRA